jgi:hypothetical protein
VRFFSFIQLHVGVAGFARIRIVGVAGFARIRIVPQQTEVWRLPLRIRIRALAGSF